ncbi:ATP-binding protein [Desulfosporosinus sp. Sb-LF]|uniref:ATP-binding protein n=1 Tax=Desulfosporosinus sp. Sb-LF TaxID=2560027 RepID=UPI00107FBDDA|nr:ATP-binding protein [Desulfosporosinus sp. Sb-LF]TGE32188.1 HAMP domain-containing histidine kinase [Desulfosporosinus sp. Sb-LF]
MEKKRGSIRDIIGILFIVIIICTFSIIGYVVFSSWKVSVNNIIAEMENDANQDILNKMEKFLSVPLYINEANHNLIENQIVRLYTKKDREIYFAEVLKANNEGEVYSFSFGTEDGDYYGARRNEKNQIEIMENNVGTNGNTRYYSISKDLTVGELVEETGRFDCRTRDWYKVAKEKQKPVFSPIYKHFVMDDLAVSAAYPIYKNGILQGVLGTHIILSNINNYLKDVVKDKQATAFIVEKNSGELVANSLGMANFENLADNQIKRKTIQDINNRPIIEAYQNYRQKSETNFIVNTNSDKLHIKLTDYQKEGLDWLIITAIPESPLTVGINQKIIISIVLSMIALIIAILIYIKSTEKVLKPIYNLIDATEKFAKGDFSQRAMIFRNDEIGKLSSAFNNMAEELYLLINNLEEKVRERTRELEKINNELKVSKLKAENANRAKSDFLANMSHDMKTPLTIVSAFSQELKEGKIGNLNDVQKATIENILFGTNQLTTIVENLLDLSKLSAEARSSLILNEVDVSSLAVEVANSMSLISRCKQVRLITTVADTDLIVAETRMIKRVMQNLLHNAIKFSKNGDEVHFTISSTHDPVDGVVIEVIDHGIGIPKDMQELIFNRFFQLENMLQNEQSGTGLGLAVVKKIVEAHCGTITVISENEKGTKFVVFLPTFPKLDEELV